MKFFSPHQHSVSQIKRIAEALVAGKEKPLSLSEDLHIATELVQHGSPRAKNFINQIEKKVSNDLVNNYLRKLLLQLEFIQSIPNLTNVLSNENLLQSLYRLNGFFFERGAKYPNKMIVVFTTMFNNFYLSNPVLYALLSQFGITLLVLKDATRFNYLNGVDGFAQNPHEIANQITLLARAKKIDEIYITGFSSGGYVSLLCSSLINCRGYLGFSITSDLSKNSTLKPGKYFTNDVSSKVSPMWLADLGAYLVIRRDLVNRKIYYGINSPRDKSHAINLSDVPNLSTISIADCDHHSIAALIENKELTNVFEETLFNSN